MRFLEPAIKALTSHDYVVFCASAEAAEVLMLLGDKRAVDPLVKSLDDKRDFVRCAAAKALGVLGDKRAVVPLIKSLCDETNFVRSAVAIALGNIGDSTWLKWIHGDNGDFYRLGLSHDKRIVDPLIMSKLRNVKFVSTPPERWLNSEKQLGRRGYKVIIRISIVWASVRTLTSLKS